MSPEGDLLSFGGRSSVVAYVTLLGKEGPPPPLSTGEALLGVGLVLAGIALAVVIAALRSRSNRF
jgi:hypothetical protein